MKRVAVAFAVTHLIGCMADAGSGTGGGTGTTTTTTATTTTASTSLTLTIPDAAACEECPTSAVMTCTGPGAPVSCCNGGEMACARPAGVLTTACDKYGLTCVSGVCAVRLPQGAVSCCDTPGEMGPDPCDI